MEITPIFPFFFFISLFNLRTSSASLTKDNATQDMLWLKTKSKSSRSFFVKQGSDILVFGKLTPLLELSAPPKTTFVFTRLLLSVETT